MCGSHGCEGVFVWTLKVSTHRGTVGFLDCGRKPGNVEGTSKYLHTDDPKQDLPGFLQGFHPSAHFSTTPTVRGHVCLDLSQEGTPETFQLLVETFPLQMSSSLWENLENTHIQKVPAPDRQGSRSAFHGRTLSSSFPKDPDNGAGLAWGSRLFIGSPPPVRALCWQHPWPPFAPSHT